MISRVSFGAFILGVLISVGIFTPIIISKNSDIEKSIELHFSTSGLSRCYSNPFISFITPEEFSSYEAWALTQRLSTRRLIRELQNIPRPGWEKLIPVIPGSCSNHITRLGTQNRDGSKLICGLDQMDDRNCMIFSLGCNNEWEFEVELLNRKKGCRTITFDCTGTFFVPPNISDRAKVLPVCWGLDPRNVTFGREQDLTTMMKNNNVKHLNFLKMDIEMGEWKYFEDIIWNTNKNNSKYLPDQIVVEVHWKDNFQGVPTDLERLGKLVDGWYDLGYRIVAREINLSGTCPECYEVTLVRFRC